MQAQSTAPLSRGARRAYSMLAAASILLLGAGIGVTIYGALMEPALIEPYRGVMVAPTATTTSRLVSRDPKGIGAVGSFDYDAVVWVDETGLWLYQRADANHDSKGTSAAIVHWDTLTIPARTDAMVVNRHANAFQVEVLEGPLLGRRGWADIGYAFRDTR